MTIRHRPLALTAFAPLVLVACGTTTQPSVTSPSSESYQRSTEVPSTHPPSVHQDDAGRPEPFPEGAPAPEAREHEGMPMRGPSDEPTAPPVAAPHDGDGRGESGFGVAEGSGASGASKSEAKSAEAYRGRGGHSPYRHSPPEYRPGLATEWGEARTSHVSSAAFSRADESRPFAMGKLFYNDWRGLEGMSGGRHDAYRATFAVGSGVIDVGLRTDDGRFVSGFTANGDHFVPGHAGERYTIVVRNQGPGRMEIVASVDGLDVIDGRPASLAKRGYLVEPWGQVEIEGFRTSTREVASFRFGSVAQSYAAKKHGDTRNVGVIGIAAFHEQGDAPWRWTEPRYRDRRMDAEPFPMRFSAPPR
ncbi:MAG: hypothetical protein FJ095_03335 [Deltaproteobacteria bacterium]|nr:hypothetical protein [Deltaproteobacteria bacterium]